MKVSDKDLTEMGEMFSFEFFKLRTSSEDMMWERSPRGASILEHNIKELYKRVVQHHIRVLSKKEETINLRNQLAGLAMQGILSANPAFMHGNVEVPVPTEVAIYAVQYADALINELKK